MRSPLIFNVFDTFQWRIQGGFLVARKPPPPAMIFFSQGVTPLLAPTFISHLHLRRSETPLETNSGYATAFHNRPTVIVNLPQCVLVSSLSPVRCVVRAGRQFSPGTTCTITEPSTTRSRATAVAPSGRHRPRRGRLRRS